MAERDIETAGVSVVVPCYNEEESLPELHRRVGAVCEALGLPYEIVLVDDGSRDATWRIIDDLAQLDPRVRGVKLARNHGHQLALTAGLAEARGARVLMIDADLQDPPELLPEMMRLMDQGYDVVYGRRIKREGETRFKTWSAAAFYRAINRVSDVPIPTDVGDFRLVSRRVLDAFLAMPERARFIRGMFAWLGHPQVALDYKRDARFAGETKYPLRAMLRFAADALTGFSTAPLRLATTLAYLTLMIAAATAVYVLWSVFTQATAPGWASLLLAVSFFSGIQLLTLGIIGEYLGRLYTEAKGRPLFLIEARAGGHASGMAAADAAPSDVKPAVAQPSDDDDHGVAAQ